MLIVITATFTADPVEESIAFWMKRLGVAATIRFAPYDQVFRQLLDADSLVSTHRGITGRLCAIHGRGYWPNNCARLWIKRSSKQRIHDNK